jgi:hypothetical protein
VSAPHDHHTTEVSGTFRTAALAAAIVACSGLIAIALQAEGIASRRAPGRPAADPGVAEIVLARTDNEVVRTWRSRGLRGRTVVHAGRFLHFVADEGRRLTLETLSSPGTGKDLDRLLVSGAGVLDYLWVTASLNVARRIYYVSPPLALETRLASMGDTRGALPLRIDEEATPRALDGSPPRIGEPVLLDVNASWFDESDGPALAAALRAAALRCDLVTISLAEDAADVSPRARNAARAFARALETRAEEILP